MELKFYMTSDGKQPALEVIKSFEKVDRAKIYGCLESIELLGFDTPRVEFRHIEGKLWEIKIKSASGGYRVFYLVIQKNMLVLLHTYKKQSQKAPDREIKTAMKRLKEVLDHMKPITLQEVIVEEMKDEEFAILYEKERVINKIACAIVEMRQRKGLTQSELAEKAHTTQPVIARLERGADSRIPSLELLGRIAHALGKEIVIDFKPVHQH